MKSSFLHKFLSASAFAAMVLSLDVVNAQSLPPGVQDVVKLKQAGLSDDVILSQVRNSGATYNLTAEQIISLKQAGVAETVIKALISGSGTAAVVTAPPVAPASVAPPVAPASAMVATPPPGAAPVASLDSFQAQLSPYGNWIQVPGYGLCWQPSVAVSDPLWRPYLDAGHWVYTDDGWSWQSDYPWGNVAFHYGRWFRLNGLWMWAPGYDWAPAWVSWREADGYSGWAPLPPAAVFRPGLGLYYHDTLAVDVDFGLGPDDFTFVAYDHFWDPNLRIAFVPHDHVVLFFGHSHVMNGYRMDHGRFVVEGLGRDHIALVTHHEVRIERESPRGRVEVRDVHDVRAGPHDNRVDPRDDRSRRDRGF